MPYDFDNAKLPQEEEKTPDCQVTKTTACWISSPSSQEPRAVFSAQSKAAFILFHQHSY